MHSDLLLVEHCGLPSSLKAHLVLEEEIPVLGHLMECEHALHQFSLKYDRFYELDVVFKFLGLMVRVENVQSGISLYLSVIGHEPLSHVNYDVLLFLMHLLNSAIFLLEVHFDVPVFKEGLLLWKLILKLKLP